MEALPIHCLLDKGSPALVVRAIVMVGVVHLSQLPVAPRDDRRGIEATLLKQMPANAAHGRRFTSHLDASIAGGKLDGAQRCLQGRLWLTRPGTAMQPGDVEPRGGR